jgi:hypothetical protein
MERSCLWHGYDRRNDPNNSLIDLYGCWGTIAPDGSVSFSPDFGITTESFPPSLPARWKTRFAGLQMAAAPVCCR